MSTAAMRARFVEDGVSAAPPQVLLINLYDRLIVDLRQGAAALREGERQVSHNKLVHAQSIITALTVGLEGSDWTGTQRLRALYDHLLVELAQANVRMDADRVERCLGLVEPLREAWFQASLELASAAVPAAVPAAGASGMPARGTTA